MARYEVEGPDGSRYEVTMPEGMTPEQISTRLKEHFASMGIEARPVQGGAPKGPQPKFPGLDFTKPVEEVRAGIQALPSNQRTEAFNEWAKTYVANERKGGGIKQATGDAFSNMVRGTIGGSWKDEIDARLNATKYAFGLGGAPYDESLAYLQETNAAIDRESTKLGSLPVIGDVTVGGVQKLAGGVLSAPVTPMVNVMRGATMLPRVVNAAATGVTYGTLYGAGEGNTTSERLGNAGVGAMIGGGLGAAAPPIATGASRMFARTPKAQGALAPMDRRAVSSVADDVVADGRVGYRPVEPEAMIADMGPNLQGHTGAIARMPGEGKAVVIDALGATVGHGRRGGAPARIQADVDAVLGPPQNLVQLEQNMLDQSRALAEPYYQQFYRTPVQPTPRLQQYIDFAERTGVVDAADRAIARKQLISPGEPVSQNMRIDYISRELNRLSDYAQTAAAGLDRTAAGQFRQIAHGFRDEVDSILRATDAARRGVPPAQGISSWDLARRHAGSGLQFEEGLERGANVFKKGTSPDQMRADMAAMTPFEDAAFRVGARGQIRDIMGEASSTLGSTGDSAVMRRLGSDYARDKLAQVAGQPGADRIVNRLETEGIYEQTRQAAVGNSVTSAMQENLKRYRGRTDPQVGGNIPDSLWGDTKKAAGWVLNKMTAGYLDARSRQQALDAARILTAQGPQRDAFIMELESLIRRRNITQRQRAAGEQLLESIITGGRGAAIGGATQPPAPAAAPQL